jgi:hypothetical protein
MRDEGDQSMSDGAPSTKRRLAAAQSQASTSPLAEHEDALSPVEALRESVGAGGGQRVGDGLPVDGPVVSFPGDDELPVPRG